MKYLVCDLYGDEYEQVTNPVLVVPLTPAFHDAVSRALGLFPWVAGRDANVARIDVDLPGVLAYERPGDLPDAIAERDFDAPTLVDVPEDAMDADDGLEIKLAVLAVTGGDRVSGEIQVVVLDDREDEVRLWAGPIATEDVAAWRASGISGKAATDVAEPGEAR
ncbi:MAG: hypothetical protein BGO49_00660 [Planctomycetales bacterium 71-10]|nr:MAG: hypothetical protein BGO49_00660 [Planctomycetales bacterium 71-10]